MNFSSPHKPVEPQRKTQSSFVRTLRYILSDPKKIRFISDAAFDSVDHDKTGFLNKEDLANILKNVSVDMKIRTPSDQDIDAIMRELSMNSDKRVSKDEFVKLIEEVLRKMLESEEELEKKILGKV